MAVGIRQRKRKFVIKVETFDSNSIINGNKRLQDSFNPGRKNQF